jgi:hypothetical protein
MMPTAPYNPWYDATYSAILGMARWEQFEADVPKKVACIFAWMPQTIMSVKHAGGAPRWVYFGPEEVARRFSQAAPIVATLRDLHLGQFVVAEHGAAVESILGILFPPFGSVAASKLLHFSIPKLFPMWDRRIRHRRGHPDSPAGYVAYMKQFRDEIANPANLELASAAYAANPVRGWDVVCMRGRDA